MKARRLFDADATDGYLLDGKYWIEPLIAGVKTNADRVRIMTNEELAHLLHSAEEHLFTGNLWNYEKWMDWLEQEVESDGED